MTKRTKTLNFCSLFFVLYSLNRIFASSNQFNHININQNNKTMKLSKLWVLAATLICGATLFTACSKDDDDKSNQEKNISEKIIGKWMVEELNGQPCPTNLKAVITFLSPTKAYGSLSDYYSDSWNDHALADVTIENDDVTLTAFENEYTKHVTKATIYSITDNEMMLKSDWKVYVDDEKMIDEVWDRERYVRITDDYEQDIIGTWEGRVTSSEDEYTDGEVHRWEYKANGTYVYYTKVDGEWRATTDVMADYFVDGILLCTRWKKTADSEELREWWEIESIKNGVMKWKALRMREDGSTYTATFQMNKVQ